jgi:hypothetical protein
MMALALSSWTDVLVTAGIRFWMNARKGNRMRILRTGYKRPSSAARRRDLRAAEKRRNSMATTSKP